MTLDKNGKTILCGDIVKIEGAYFKSDCGYWYVEQDGTNESYSGDGLTLKKIGKRGKISTAKYSIAFWPLCSFCSDRVKNAEANAHNEKNATIEVVYDIDNTAVIDWIRKEIESNQQQIDYWELHFGEGYESPNRKSKAYFEKALARLTEETEEPTQGAQTAETAAPEEEPTEETETEQTDEEQPEETPESDKPDYSALAAAYFTGKTIKANKKPRKEEPTPEPEQTATEDESEPQETPKTAPGFTGEPSDILTEEEAERLNNGEQVRKDTESYNRIFTAARYTDRTALLYSIDRYQYRDEPREALQPGDDFHYIGFITNGKTYTNADAIREEMREDIAEAIRQAVPDEATARANAERCEEWERNKIESAEEYGANNAKNLFYKDETPQLYLYSHMEKIKSVDLIRYIEDPAQVVTEYATAYAKSHAAEIAADYIRYNLLIAAIKAIKDNPSDPAHTIKKISHCIGETEKTAKVELSSGEVVTVEARAIRMITSGEISSYYVKAYDRDKLPKNEHNRPEDIQPEQIKAIYHGQRTLYKATPAA